MSDYQLTEKSTQTDNRDWDLNKAAQSFVSEACDLWQQTSLHSDKRLRQVQGLAHGLVSGVGDQIFHHPGDVLVKTFSGATTGMLVGCAMPSENRRIALAGTICGAGISGKWLVDRFDTSNEHNQKRNTAITDALSDLWTNNDTASYYRNVDTLAHNLGPAVVDAAQAAIAIWFAGRVTGGYKALLSRQLF